MDMWGPYIAATQMIPEALTKIPCGRPSAAVDGCGARSPGRSSGGKRNPHGVGTSGSGPRAKDAPGEAGVRGCRRHAAHGRGLGAEEAAANLWCYEPDLADRRWNRWLDWASRCRLDPVVKAARMVREHLWGIVNAVISGATNGPAEGINSRIKTIKARSRGFRNQERFANAIYFHLVASTSTADGLTHDQSPT